QDAVAAQAAANGVPFVFNDGNILPITLRLVDETTRFREYGPLSGHTYMLSGELSPGIGSFLKRTTVEADVRGYQRLLGDLLVAGRFHGFRSTGTNPAIFYFGGDMDLRG